MLPRLFATAFVNRFAMQNSAAPGDSLERALIGTGVALAAARRRRIFGITLIAAGGALAWARRRRAARR